MKNFGGHVIWISGLSGAGKTSVSNHTADLLIQLGQAPIVLDGDKLRELLNASPFVTKSVDREGRLALAQKYSNLCKLLADQDQIVIIATISMFDEVYKWNHQNLPGYFEVFLDTPINVLKSRDPKKLYARFDLGEIQNVAGMDLSVDVPMNSHLFVTHDPYISPKDIAKEILQKKFPELACGL